VLARAGTPEALKRIKRWCRLVGIEVWAATAKNSNPSTLDPTSYTLHHKPEPETLNFMF